MRFYGLVLAALAVWRLTHLLADEDGPWDLVVRLRRAAGDGLWGRLLDCFACLSVWIAAPFAYLLGASWGERLLLWPALSGAAMLLQRATDRTPPAVYHEEELEEDALLRSEPPEPAPRAERPRV